MQFIRNFFTAMIVFSVALVSCQKEIDWNTNQPTGSDSTYIALAIALDTTLPVGTDTVQWVTFNYDAQKRLSVMTSLFRGAGTVLDTIQIGFAYNGNDTIPNKYVLDEKYHFGASRNYDQTTVFMNFSNGLVSYDSTLYMNLSTSTNNGARVNRYLSSGSTVTRYETNYDFVAGNYQLSYRDTGVYAVTTTLGNISSQSILSGNGAYQQATVTYDNKPNPISKALKLRYQLFESPYFEVWSFQPSNTLQVQFQEPFNPVFHETYTYRYRADGYPLSQTYQTDNGAASYNKALYFYRTL